MSSPSLNRCSLPCGRLPSKLLSGLLLFLIVCLHFHSASSQLVQVRKTIKEELLPGTIIADLANEPNFLKIVQSAVSSGTVFNDPSTGAKLHYSILTSGNPHSQYFAVNQSSGVISINKNIDRERVCSFRDECHLSFEVAARSVYNAFFLLVDFVIVVTDINDNPPEFSQLQFELNIPEKSPGGRSFQLPVAFDRDTGPGNGVANYKIVSENPPMFDLTTKESSLNTSDLFLVLKSTITRDSADLYTVLVGAVDGGVPSLTGTLTVAVHVSDINDNFPVFEKALYVVSIPEDKRNDQVIQKVQAHDADSDLNGELVYSFSVLQPQDDLDFFRIDPKTGEIFLTKSIESRTGDEIELVVEASDKGHPPKVSRTRVKVQVEDTINSMPDIIVDMLGGAKGVAEVSEYAEIGKVVAHVSVRDPDSGDNGRTDCTLGKGEFELIKLDDEGKYKAVLMSKLDREKKEMYNVTVSCSDHGFPSLLARENFAIRVLDENDEIPTFSERTYQASVYENDTVGSPIAQLTVTDRDTGPNADVWFDVVGINKRYFNIDATGNMTTKIPLDREYSDMIVATIVATDRGVPPLSSSATVVVTLQDVNDMRPEFSQMIYRFEVEENQPAGKYVDIVSASDMDKGVNKEIFYHILDTGNASGKLFEVEADGGIIKTTAVLDREKKDQHNFLVLATDKGEPPLTGTASVIIKVIDINDNDPYFIFPARGNDSLSIPHTFNSEDRVVTVLAHDDDVGVNGEVIYTVSSVNTSVPFSVNPTSGALHLTENLTPSDVGMYFLTLSAHDQGSKQQRATQAPLYLEVFFDNSTLLASAGAAGPSRAMVTALIIVGVTLFVIIPIIVIVVCYRKHAAKRKQNGGVPNSASTSSTAKLQGSNYYVSPGVRGSTSSSFQGKAEGTINNNVNHDPGDGLQNGNNYVDMLPRTESEVTTEVIAITRPGHSHGLNDTLNTADLDQTDDGQFSTFKSTEDILSPGLRQGSLRRQDPDGSIAKGGNETFDDMSCDDSTSDSGRGGSDVDVNGAAAAAKQEKARAQAATPISMKSGISHRLSPLPREPERTFVTFRGDSPSSFRFDSDSDTLTRNGGRPMMSSPTSRDAPRFEPGSSSAFSGPAGRLSESDTDTEHTPRSRFQLHPQTFAGIHSPHAPANGYSSGGEGGQARHPLKVGPLPMFMPPSYQRHDSETDYSDGASNPSNSLSRRNYVPRLPLYPGIEFSHHAYGASNRNSIGAFSNHSAASNSDGFYPDYTGGGLPYSDNPNNSGYFSSNFPPNNVPDSRVTSNYGNVVSELQESRPVSMEEDFLLPPYPQVDEEEEDQLNIHSGYTGFSPEREERAALFSRSQFESSA